ncbi:unnamed protein product [Rangifer tarandus platyrhynchus]|uniref:Uncharacterized protein n=2 Tax=Rangifer tarandus platyrhynchus TaxID=3082113 RepID=A0ABN8ZYN0_RANTA|nr:unnamed protein product [Rangifer tarandus platyrhynchus]
MLGHPLCYPSQVPVLELTGVSEQMWLIELIPPFCTFRWVPGLIARTSAESAARCLNAGALVQDSVQHRPTRLHQLLQHPLRAPACGSSLATPSSRCPHRSPLRTPGGGGRGA